MNNERSELKDLFFSKTWGFLNEYMPERLCRSKETIESYRDSLTIFRRFLLNEQNLSIEKFCFNDCTRELLFEFRSYLKDMGNKSSTINVRMTALHVYLRYAANEDIALQSIAMQIASIPPLKVPKKEKAVISDEGLAAMFEAPPNTKKGIRDRTIMILLYDSAVRLDEILSLTLKDIRFDNKFPCILLHGKGNKERRIVISEKTAKHIQNYMSLYHQKYCRSDFLFYTIIKGQKGKMSHGNVQRFLKKYAAQVRESGIELPETVYPHMLRRTKATALYQNGVPIEMISTLLGHSQIETTRIYISPSINQLKEAIEKVDVPTSNEQPLWETDENALAKLVGLR